MAGWQEGLAELPALSVLGSEGLPVAAALPADSEESVGRL